MVIISQFLKTGYKNKLITSKKAHFLNLIFLSQLEHNNIFGPCLAQFSLYEVTRIVKILNFRKMMEDQIFLQKI